MPGIGFVGQNLCLAYLMLNKTYSWHTFCWTKPIPGIGYVRLIGNLFLAYVMLDKTKLWDLAVKICKTRCFLSKKIFSKIK